VQGKQSPPPAAPALKGSESLPEFFELRQANYEYPDDDKGIRLISGEDEKPWPMAYPWHSMVNIV
jgi:hypothetical protein